MRPVTVVVRSVQTRHEAFAKHNARARAVGGPKVKLADDAAVDHRYSDASPVKTGRPELIRVDSLSRDVERTGGVPIRRDVNHLRIRFNAADHGNWHSHVNRGNRAILPLECTAL